MTEPFKPCPFCGQAAKLKIEDDHHGEFFYLGCCDKECAGYEIYFTSPIEELEKSTQSWNRRVKRENDTRPN